MTIRVEIDDNSEWFSDIDDAINYLENHRGDEEDYDEPMSLNPPTIHQDDPKTISLSKKYAKDILGQSLDDYLLKGYKILYEGKTGYTLEKTI